MSYFDYIPNDVIVSHIIPKVKLYDIIQVIPFTEKEYKDIFRIKFKYAYNIINKSIINFTCNHRSWKDLVYATSTYENASDPTDKPFDILSFYYASYLKGDISYMFDVWKGLDTWTVPFILKSVEYRDPLKLDADTD